MFAKITSHAAGMHTPLPYLRCLTQLEGKHNVILAFLCPCPSFPIKEMGKCPSPSFPCSSGLTIPHWSPSYTRLNSVTVAACLSSCWHHVNGQSSLFVICFVMVSPGLKVFITVVSVFYKEHVI